MFSNLDITQAYHQMEVEEKFQHLFTITTHKRALSLLPHSFWHLISPGSIPEDMEQILQGIPGVVAFMDDTELIGATVEEQCQVFQRLCLELLHGT